MLVSPADALPYWSVLYGSVPAFQVFYHGISIGASRIAVEDANFIGSFQAISGNFSVLFQGGLEGDPLTPTDVTITQSGTVPALSQSLLFKTRGAIPEGWLEVYFQNQLLPIQPVQSLANNINVYGCDISAFESQYGELKLTGVAPTPFGLGAVLIDDLEFSPTLVPEPSSVALFLLGTGLLVWHRRTKRHAA
jgi:hypothetical protein